MYVYMSYVYIMEYIEILRITYVCTYSIAITVKQIYFWFLQINRKMVYTVFWHRLI